MLLFYTIDYYNGAVHMRIFTPLTRSQCKVSDTQVTVRPVGLLLYLFVILKSMSNIHVIILFLFSAEYI